MLHLLPASRVQWADEERRCRIVKERTLSLLQRRRTVDFLHRRAFHTICPCLGHDYFSISKSFCAAFCMIRSAIDSLALHWFVYRCAGVTGSWERRAYVNAQCFFLFLWGVKGLAIIRSAEAFPILCVRCARWERERERERERDGSDVT